MKRFHAVVSGRVQGVNFRYFTLRAAKDLDLTGWVRNRFNGDVELIAEGPQDALNALLEAVRQGPSASRVENVEAEWEQAMGEFSKFKVRLTG